MLTTQLICVFLAIAAVTLCYYLIKKKHKKVSDKFFKVTSLILAAVFFFRFMLGFDALRLVFKLGNSPIAAGGGYTICSLILNWMLYSIILLVILYPFFKSSKLATLVKYYSLIVALLCLVFIKYVTIGIEGAEAYSSFSVRALLMGIEIGILIGYSFIIFMENGRFKVEKKDAISFVYIIGMLLATMPPYMLKALFGYVNYTIELADFTLPHRIILYISVLLPLALYFLLRKKDKATIKMILLYISLATLISFSITHRFETFKNITNWPFHLCNTAMYIIPLCLIFNWKKLFYFTYFINVFGAFIAMIFPNYSASLNLFSTEILRFYINHYIAFFMPILMVALRVYERPKLREFKYSMVGFGIYFLLVLILNAWFSNYGSVDYFFINSDFIAEKLGRWAEDLRNVVWSFNIKNLIFTFYPLYQALFFLGYVAIGAGVWFVYEGSYTFADTIIDIQERKTKMKADELALIVALNGKSKEEPMNPDGKNKIILRNFSKLYGKSDVYAVKDANLEIVGGEIFGFLGHNGAGKSTIIKSIVGIQPITSGSIEVCGYDVDLQPVMAKRNIGFVPDNYALYEKLTGREYINYIADLYDVSLEDRTKAIEKYVSLFELNDAFDNQIKTYSHGMKQKIAIMAALVHNPKVWILDEPLTGLDPNSIYQVKECMKQHAKKGNVVFFSSHIIDVVKQICDKIAIIKKGRILTCRYIKDIEKECPLEEFYLKTTEMRVDSAKVSKKEMEKHAKHENVKTDDEQVKTEDTKKEKGKEKSKAKKSDKNIKKTKQSNKRKERKVKNKDKTKIS